VFQRVAVCCILGPSNLDTRQISTHVYMYTYAECCRVSQSFPECCRVLHSVAECCSVLHFRAVKCRHMYTCIRMSRFDFPKMQHTVTLAACYTILQHSATHCNTLQHSATLCNTRIYVYVCRNYIHTYTPQQQAYGAATINRLLRL